MSDVVRFGAEYFQDPHTLHADLREIGPVVPVEVPDGYRGWMLTRYEDVRAALNDQRLYKDFRKLARMHGMSTDQDPSGNTIDIHMLNSDPPDHSRLRRLVTTAFTARRVASLRPRVEQITTALLDEMEPRSGSIVDLLAEFAFPLPVTVISELLGVPAADRDKFRTWSALAVSSVAGGEEVRSAIAEMIEYFATLLEAKRTDPADDLLSALLRAGDDGDRLSVGEQISMVFLLLIAGHETTVNLIASGMLALMLNPSAHARLRADRSLLPAAIEEMLRYTSPVNNATVRFTLEPTTIAGTEIPAGELVIASLSSANRDMSKFAEPGSFDIGRDAGGHVAFGHGIHFCLGAPLARLEAEVAFGGLLDRFPDMTLAVPEAELRWRPSTLIRGLEALPVSPRG